MKWSVVNGEMLVKSTQESISTYRNTVKQTIIVLLVLFEDPNILENLRLDLDSVIVSYGIFTEEIEDDEVWWLEGNVLAPKRTTANGIRFIFTLLITSTQSQTINKVHGCCTLSVCHKLTSELDIVILANAVDMFLHDEVSSWSFVLLFNNSPSTPVTSRTSASTLHFR